jgi:hypothetical protein
MVMILLGLTGAIEHGKSSLARFLTESAMHGEHLESSNLIIEVADALRAGKVEHPKADDLTGINKWLAQLPAILKTHTHCAAPKDVFVITKEHLATGLDTYQKLFEYFGLTDDWPALARGPITGEVKQHVRPLLQWLGGYCVKNVSDIIWFDELIRRVETTGDLELAVIGGVRFASDAGCIKTSGGHIINIVRPNTGAKDIGDLTERERGSIKADILVTNDGTLKQLEATAHKIYEDLLIGRVKGKYTASNF